MPYQIIVSTTSPLPQVLRPANSVEPAQAEQQLAACKNQNYKLVSTVAAHALVPQGAAAPPVQVPVVVYTMEQ